MPHLRIFRHYIHTPFLLMAALEAVLLVVALYCAGALVNFGFRPPPGFFLSAVVFALTLLIAMSAMGVYESRLREGYAAMMLRSAVAIFLLGILALWIIGALIPRLPMTLNVTVYGAGIGFVLLAVWRWTAPQLISEDRLKQRVLVLGAGSRAAKIASRMRRRSDQRGFVLVGFLEHGPANAAAESVSQYGARVLTSDQPLLALCRQHDVHEIVVAIDERRRDRDAGGGLPLTELMDCRLSGIRVCDVQQFIEREACKVDVDLLRTSWLVFSDGFMMNPRRALTKRLLDLSASALLLLVFWPVMIVIALAILIESRFRGPIFLRQERVGLSGKPFQLLKFRSMVVDAEAAGPVWARANEDRTTRVGRFIRKSRLDELPQLVNVFKGEMSFVGPRPERPVFVRQLTQKIPYYAERHRVKPGITGWAQLCYPYGASVQDAKEKLQYDLYYLKNQSILLDLIILLQTVEVVLVGEGAR